MDHQRLHHLKPSLINRSLLSPKLFILFLSTGETSLLPFLPMYFRFIGLTAFQTGILGCVRPLVSFWATPLLRVFAERANKKKCWFLSLLLAGIIFNVSLGLISGGPKSDFQRYICPRGSRRSLNSTTDLQNNHTRNFSSSDRTSLIYITESTRNRNGTGTTGVLSDNAVVTNPAIESTNSSESLLPRIRDFSWRRPSNFIKSMNRTGSRTDNFSRNFDRDHELKPNDNLTADQKAEGKLYLVYGFKLDRTFKVLLILVFFCELFSASMRGVCRSIFADMSFENKGSHLGNSLWTSLGTVVGACIIIMALGYHRCDFGLKNSFYVHFYTFAFCGTASFVFGTLMKNYEQQSSLNFRFRNTVVILCCDAHILCFLALLLILGMAESLMYNFMMWYLQDIGASLTVMGLALMVSAFSEIPMHCVSKNLIRCFGHHWIIFLSLFSYAARFLYFSFTQNPWLIIPIELLHGLSYTTVHSVCNSYAASVSLHGTEKTMKAIFSSVYYGFGMGFGGIAVSLLYQLHGPIVMFRCAAGVCAVYGVVFVLLQCILVFPYGDRSGGKLMEYQQISLGGEKFDFPHQPDWLMEALQAEEDEEDETHFMR